MTKLYALVASAAVTLGASAASATVVYDWTGTCTNGCTGTATAVLTLDDAYTPGTALANSDFISFEFTSDAGSYTVPGAMTFLEFDNPSSLPTTTGTTETRVDFTGGGTYFFQYASGNWDTWLSGSSLAQGNSGVWELRVSEVPLPGGMSMLVAGIGGLGFAKRRKRG